MPKICHNAPGLRYKVYWKQNMPGQVWNFKEITDYTINGVEILNQPTDKHYKVKVVAFNEKGESSGLQEEVIGHSGEESKFSHISLLLLFYCNYLKLFYSSS